MPGSTSSPEPRSINCPRPPPSLGTLGVDDARPSFVYSEITYQPIEGSMKPTYPLWCANYTAEEAIQQAVADYIKASFGLVIAESRLQSAADSYMACNKQMSELSIHLGRTGQREDLARFTRVFRDLKRMSLEEKKQLLAGLKDVGL
ncbi:hypothetical protein H1R20_g15834, partial [Candolleomyces eurysporus]